MEACYMPVNHETKLPKLLRQIIEAVPDEAWMPYYNFMALPLEKEVTDFDPFMRKLAEKRKFRSGILRVEADTCYNWHVDSERKSA